MEHHENNGFPRTLISLICKLYGNQESAVRTGAGITEWFKVGRGVRQGCILSPSLYNLYAEDIMRTALEEKVWGVKVGGVRRSNLRYADDTTLLSSSKEELLQMIRHIETTTRQPLNTSHRTGTCLCLLIVINSLSLYSIRNVTYNLISV